MLDRKTPPVYHPLTDIKLQSAEQRHLRKGVPLHIINAGKQEVVRLEVIFRAGSIQESKKAQAFLATKMLSEGSTRYSAREIATIMDSYGAHLDLTAGFDSCTVAVYTLNKHLPAVLPVFKSMVTEPAFNEKELDTVKSIRMQKLRVDNSKNSVIASKNFRKLLFSDHPYGSIIEENDISEITPDDLHQFFARGFFQNFELLISGAVTPEVEALVAGAFADIPFRRLPDSELAVAEVKKPVRENILKKGSLQSSIRTGKLLFNLHHPDFNHFNVLNTIFGGYFGSRLMRSIREEKGYTYGIYSSVVPMRRSGYLAISTDVIGEFTNQTIDEIFLQIRNLQDTEIERTELDTVKNYILGSFLSGLNTPFALADQFKTIYLNQLPDDYYERYIQEINEVTAEELQILARKYLAPEDLSTVVVGEIS